MFRNYKFSGFITLAKLKDVRQRVCISLEYKGFWTTTRAKDARAKDARYSEF